MLSCFHVCLSVCLFTGSERSRMTITYDALNTPYLEMGPHCTGSPGAQLHSRPPTSDHHWIPVQTCSLEDPQHWY